MKKYKDIIIALLLSAIVGITIGVTAGFYGEALHWAEKTLSENYMYMVPFLGFAGVLILYIYKRISPDSEQGLNLAIAYNMGVVDNKGQINEQLHENESGKYPKPYALLKLFSNITMLLFGASTGKEGSFAAFGASIGDYVSRIFKGRRFSRTLLISGVAAAVSGLFQTPLGGVFFGLEFTAAGVMAYNALLPAVVASYCAFFFSRLCGFDAFSHIITDTLAKTPANLGLIITAAIIFGLFGKLFAVVLKKSHKLYDTKIHNRFWGIFITGTIMSVLFIIIKDGRYCGTGALMFDALFETGNFELYDFALKFLFTIICITAGFSGGEMMPLLSIGAALGATIASFTGLPVSVMAAIGAASVYCSATNTLIAPIFIGIEMFGTDLAIYITLCCIIAYSINGNRSVYSMQGNINSHIYEKLFRK